MVALASSSLIWKSSMIKSAGDGSDAACVAAEGAGTMETRARWGVCGAGDADTSSSPCLCVCIQACMLTSQSSDWRNLHLKLGPHVYGKRVGNPSLRIYTTQPIPRFPQPFSKAQNEARRSLFTGAKEERPMSFSVKLWNEPLEMSLQVG